MLFVQKVHGCRKWPAEGIGRTCRAGLGWLLFSFRPLQTVLGRRYQQAPQPRPKSSIDVKGHEQKRLNLAWQPRCVCVKLFAVERSRGVDSSNFLSRSADNSYHVRKVRDQSRHDFAQKVNRLKYSLLQMYSFTLHNLNVTLCCFYLSIKRNWWPETVNASWMLPMTQSQLLSMRSRKDWDSCC